MKMSSKKKFRQAVLDELKWQRQYMLWKDNVSKSGVTPPPPFPPPQEEPD